MTNFEKIAATPESLGEFLASLSVANGPWDEEFHREFCDGCTETCDVCRHEAERNNPLWWMTRAAEGEPVERCYTWRNGRLNLEPGIIVPLQEEPPANGVCREFNVYLNGKGTNGKILRNIQKVFLPKISTDENGRIEPTDMALVFGGCEDAAEIVNRLGEKCKLEIRAAVQSQNKSGKMECHGHSYILEAVPLELKSEPLKRLDGTGLTVTFLVYRYIATVGDTELWDFERVNQERERQVKKQGKGGESMELTGKGKDILNKAEDVILQGVERLLETPEKMTGEDCRNLQTLICTAGRIQAIRSGNFHSNYPD